MAIDYTSQSVGANLLTERLFLVAVTCITQHRKLSPANGSGNPFGRELGRRSSLSTFLFSFPFQWDGAAERKPVASDVPADAINGAGRRKPRTRRHLLVSWQPIKPKMTNLPDFFCASGRSQWDERVGGAGAAGA